MNSLDKIYYDELTWPEINLAVQEKKVVLLPIGSTEQHGHHLPLDVDNFLARGICVTAPRRLRARCSSCRPSRTATTSTPSTSPARSMSHYDHFIEYCLDVCKSVAYAGFERIVLVDGHGSNEHLCEFIARRATLETDAMLASVMWTNLAVEAFEPVRDSGARRRGARLRAGDLRLSLSGAIPRENGARPGPLRRRGGKRGVEVPACGPDERVGAGKGRALDEQRNPQDLRRAITGHGGKGRRHRQGLFMNRIGS